MECVIEYLKSVKDSLANLENVQNIHIVLGNESCDIDSSVSAILIANYYNKHRPDFIPKDAIVVPVQNVSKEGFLYRNDNCYLYNTNGLPLDVLVYRDQINFEELVKTKNVTATLVDHHVLTEKDKILEDAVIQVLDHRPEDPYCCWDYSRVKVRIQTVGSCCTLVADTIFECRDYDLCADLAYMLYATIICDCKAFSLKSKKGKYLDSLIAEFLEDKYNFNRDGRGDLFMKIKRLRSDVSHLKPIQILQKDTKIIEGVPVPSMPISVQDFLKLDGLEGGYKALERFATESKALCVVLKGSNAGKSEIGIFYTPEGEQLKEKILHRLLNSKQYKGYDFEFTELKTEFKNVVLLNQGNREWTRKQLMPLIKDAAISENSG
ncbi:exopolyphosphatase PRUNE1-like [Diabrotica virgifera virgifera]|uniref:Exopolyphosphatase PRUNE1-like n=1 Tax=Diabrotica virgifera virgifera TaxID=50390 RepID=A0A6P7F8P1_DIAVI|nr:exopolyphosphatase PRUNE1-like [Diabrotica virgifera virgifera]